MGESFTKKDIKQLIEQLKKYEIRVQDVPEELRFNKDIITSERKYGLRKSGYRGYDVIILKFFVEELTFYKDLLGEMRACSTKILFESFEKYYEYLDGDIYDMACYQYYDFNIDEDFIRKNKIDIQKLKEMPAFVKQTIDNFSAEVTEEELAQYEEGEKIKEKCKKWIKKFNACNSCEELQKMVRNYDKSMLKATVDVTFFFLQYIFIDVKNQERFKIIMEYMSTGVYPEYKLINALCSIYNPDDVLELYNYSLGAKGTIYKYKKKLREYVQKLKNGNITFITQTYFDEKTHFYCEKVLGFEDNKRRWPIMSYQRYFETFDEFVKYRRGNLKATDLSKALKLSADFSQYEIDERTKLPFYPDTKLNENISKGYKKGKFYVEKRWKNEKGCLIKKSSYSTSYFFDFVYFLKGDLSNADLLFCDGLANISNMEGLILDGAKMISSLCDKFGVAYDYYELKNDVIESFKKIDENEQQTALMLNDNVDTKGISTNDSHSLLSFGEWERNCQRVYYVTDIHLMHRLKNANCKSKNDVIYVIQKIVDIIVNEMGNLLLIGGDVASDYTIFEIFISMLKAGLENRFVSPDVIFILGNHELWPFPDKTTNEIFNIYKNLIEENGMYFIQNDLIYKDSNNKFVTIEYEKLRELSKQNLREQLRSSRVVILGGIGFSGYNNEFNANNGIYRTILSRDEEIDESINFEELYNSLIPVLYDKNVIIFTHMPPKDWCKEFVYQSGFIYVSGHTHQNDFYDDGEYRFYGDNQIGYRNNNPHLKCFLMDNEYDLFIDYKDGIYEISGVQYNDFYRGKNIQMNFTREVNKLYMLKKKGFYCFIHESKKGSLTILNGGALKKLDVKDIEYYYDHMDEVISYIKIPLDKYTEIQQSISKEIIKLGGSGNTHGCIIDIDFNNHIYVNPVDLKITGYWALDIINKIVYPDIPSLLQEQCPLLYSNYLKLTEGRKKNPLMPRKTKNEVALLPQAYLSTDIYKASREIKKMQKLSSNILSSWYEPQAGANLIEKNRL